jgi:type IV secretory pathway VirB2 component (pilin)
MKMLRKLVAMLLVAMAMTLSVATTAQADAGDAAKDWSSYVCEQLELCEPEAHLR